MDYYKNYFEENKTNMRKSWEGIRSIINVTKKTKLKINKINDKGNVIEDDIGMANAMNNFFVNIGSTVEAKIPKVNRSFNSYIGEHINTDFQTREVTSNEVIEIIKKFSTGKSSGPFSIPIHILKEYSGILINPLICIINKSLREGIFPAMLKSG